MNTQKLYNALVTIIDDYQEKARLAITEGDGKLYVPGLISQHEFIQLCQDPSQIAQNGGNHKEPAYLSFKEGCEGGNSDGSKHDGFLVLDPINREIISVIDMNGQEVFSINNQNMEIIDGTWSGYKITAENSNGQKIEIDTPLGVRGRVPVQIIHNGDSWDVVSDQRQPVDIRKVVISEQVTRIVDEIVISD
jgi:hypothetical protein